MPLCLREIGPNSVGRGLFRGWIFLTVLWLIGAGTLAYFIIRREVSHWKWQYVHEARTNTLPGEVDWSRPYYEMMRSPSAENLAVTFMKLEYQYTQEWDQFVKDGKLKIVKMPDDSLLYFSTDLTEQDQLYLAKAFWDQRWWRYVSQSMGEVLDLIEEGLAVPFVCNATHCPRTPRPWCP